MCDFLPLCKYYVGVLCTKGKKGANVKTSYKFGNGPMKICFKHKIKIKVDHRNNIIVYFFFLSHKLWFLKKLFLSWAFYIWAWTFFFFQFYNIFRGKYIVFWNSFILTWKIQILLIILQTSVEVAFVLH